MKEFSYTDSISKKTITFVKDKEYYITDWFPFNRTNQTLLFPVLMKIICTEEDYEEEDVDFYLRLSEHLIYSELPLGQPEHPESITSSNWDSYFHNTEEEAWQ